MTYRVKFVREQDLGKILINKPDFEDDFLEAIAPFPDRNPTAVLYKGEDIVVLADIGDFVIKLSEWVATQLWGDKVPDRRELFNQVGHDAPCFRLWWVLDEIAYQAGTNTYSDLRIEQKRVCTEVKRKIIKHLLALKEAMS